jgi:serine/threonine-protein kinase
VSASKGAHAFGETIGRYHLHSQLAKGGMARVHIARAVGAEGFSRLVAAKRLHPALAADREFVQMFLDEANVASKVRHRNVVPVLDVVNLDGEVILVQELVHGVPLHKLCARAQQLHTRLPIPVAISIASGALAGLHAAHEAVDETGVSLNIVHRDVSPQNIMIATDGTARLLDFGVAKTAAAAHITRAGTFKGKLAYGAPEQLSGTVTRRTDIYALGVVLWELLVGQRLHASKSDDELRRAIMQTTPPSITQRLAKRRAAGEIDQVAWLQLEAIEPLIARACAIDPAKRFATAAEMERALGDAVTPALLSEVAVWLRELAGDILDETDRLIADEEASWRSARGSQPQNTVGPALDTSTSLETAADSPIAAARTRPYPERPPSVIPNVTPPPWRKWVFTLAALLGMGIGLGAAVLQSKPEPTAASGSAPIAQPPSPSVAQPVPLEKLSPPTAAATTSPPPPAAKVQPAPVEQVEPSTVPPVTMALDEEVVEEEPEEPATKNTSPKPVPRPIAVKKQPAKQPVKQPPPKQQPKPVDCSTPFYFKGNKKIFKPKCL